MMKASRAALLRASLILLLGACGPEAIPTDEPVEARASALTNATYTTWWTSSFYGSRGTFLGDVDADGKADLVGVGDGYVGLIRSTGTKFGGYETWTGQNFQGTRGVFLGKVESANNRSLLVGVSDPFIAVMGLDGVQRGWRVPGLWGTRGTRLGDVTGDGLADLVALGDANVVIARSRGDSFGANETWGSSGFYGARGTLLGDVDGDGKQDLVALDASGVRVNRSSGAGLFGAAQWGTVRFNYVGTQGNLLADLTGDGRADLIALNDGSVDVFASSGTGFMSPIKWFGAFYGSHGTVAGDATGDGVADLIGMGDGYVGGLPSPNLRAFGFQAMSDVYLNRNLPGVPYGPWDAKTLLIVAKFTTPTCASYPNHGAPGTIMHTTPYYEDLLFGTASTSVRNWMTQMSGGLFSFSRVATVELANVPGSWGTDDVEVLKGLVQRAAAQGFNFAAYDLNGDATVTSDELNVVVVSNYHNACGKGAVGSARWVSGPAGSVSLASYITALEENVAFEGATHEMAHLLRAWDFHGLGLPQAMSVMGGSSPAADGTKQYALDAWHKFTLGWDSPKRIIDLVTTPSLTIPMDGPALVWSSARGRREYTILEDRRPGPYSADSFLGTMAWPVLLTGHLAPTDQMRNMPQVIAEPSAPNTQVKWLKDGVNAFAYKRLPDGSVTITAN